MKSLTEFMSFLEKEQVVPRSRHFSLEALQDMDSLTEILRYVGDNLEYLGGGASRATWIVDEQRIIKIVHEEGSYRDNKREIRHAECLGKHYAPIVFDYDQKNYFWILEERLQPINGDKLFEKLQSLIGYRFKNWQELRQFFADSAHSDSNPLIGRLYSKSNWLRGLIDELRGCQVNSDDFHDENWGVRPSTGELVLLDLGF